MIQNVIKIIREIRNEYVSWLLLLLLLATSVVLWSGFLDTYPEAQVRFPALPDFLRSSGSGTGSTQSPEYN
jgi:hypothetical protein